jgi:replication-associated recombination protein RarA
MFEHMKRINKLVSKKVMDIESAVTKSETIFVDEINRLIKNKQELSKIERKSYIKVNKKHAQVLPGQIVDLSQIIKDLK